MVFTEEVKSIKILCLIVLPVIRQVQILADAFIKQSSTAFIVDFYTETV